MHVTPTHLNLYKEIARINIPYIYLNIMGFRSSQVVVWFIFILLSPWVSLAYNNEAYNEVDALSAFKSGLKDPQGALDSWDSSYDTNHCTWSYITCDNSSRVTRIDLQNTGLSGPLSPRIGELKNLQYLELYMNQFTGHIPAELGNLTNLVSLDLYSNSLTGNLPVELGYLQNLIFIRLQNNNLCGSPYFVSHMPNLTVFQVRPGNNNLCNVFKDPHCKRCLFVPCTKCA